MLSHFALMLAIVVLTAQDRFTFDEMFNALGVLAPLFAAYTTVIVKRAMSEEESTDARRKVPATRAFFSWMIPTVFVAFLAGLIYWKGYASLKFDSFIKALALSETLFGIYVGIVVEALFGKKSTQGQ